MIDGEGYFWHREAPIHERGNPAAARIEAEAQIDWALDRGMDIAKLDGHMAVWSTHPALLALYIDLARRYRLPPRLRTAQSYRERGRPELAEVVAAAREDLLAPDHRAGIALADVGPLEAQTVQAIHDLRLGLTELVLHAAAPSDELTAITPDAPARVEALRLVTTSEPVRQAIQQEGVQLIGWKALREAQRAGA